MAFRNTRVLFTLLIAQLFILGLLWYAQHKWKPHISFQEHDQLDGISSLTSTESHTAFHRKISTSCKEHIKQFRLSNMTWNSPESTQCHQRVDDLHSVRRLGCFRLPVVRLTTVVNVVFTDPMACTTFCSRAGIRYASVAVDNTCICDNIAPELSSRVDPAQCSTACSPFNQSMQNKSAQCGPLVPVLVFDTKAYPPFHIPAPPLISVSRVPDTKPVRIVYLLVWHGRGWLQMRRIFRLLFHPRHYYYIHVDSRSEYLYNRASVLAQLYPANVYVTDTRWAANWGGSSLLRMMLAVMRDLVTRLAGWHWDFLINLSGTDLPVRPREQLVAFLSEYRGRLFFGVNADQPRFIVSQGLSRIFLECDNYVWHLGPRAYPTGVVLDGGSDWMILPYEFVEYISFVNDPMYDQLLNYFQYSLLPAEMFFHVVAQNTRFCTSVVNHGLRYTHWDRPRGCECKHNVSVDWCGCSPVAYRGDSGMRVLCSQVGNCLGAAPITKAVFFSRKFDSTVDLNPLNFVATALLGDSDGSPTFNIYLENIYSAAEDTKEVPLAYLLGLQSIANHVFHKPSWSGNESAGIFSFPDPHLNVYAVFNATEQNSSMKPQSGHFPEPYRPMLVFQTRSSTRRNQTAVLVEALVRPPSTRFLTQVPLSRLSYGEVAYAEVTSQFDGKEQFIRNYPHLLTPNDKLQLVFYWKGDSSKPSLTPLSVELHLTHHSDLKSSCQSQPVLIKVGSSTPSAFGFSACYLSVIYLSVAFPDCLLAPGYWTVYISIAGRRVPVPFYLYPFPVTSVPSASPWFLTEPEDVCSDLPEYFSQFVSTMKPCATTSWSSLAKDMKSELPT